MQKLKHDVKETLVMTVKWFRYKSLAVQIDRNCDNLNARYDSYCTLLAFVKVSKN